MRRIALTVTAWMMIGASLAFAEPSVKIARPTAATFPATLPADFHRGVNHAHIHKGDHGYGSGVSRRELAQLRALGVTCVALKPFGFQRSATDERIIIGTAPGSGDPTMTDQGILDEARHAKALGMKVAFKPMLWSMDFDGRNEWHGTIRQTTAAGHARWWASYRAMILYYARLAQRADADLLCIGTETVRMTTTHGDEWRALIGEVRGVFRGALTYAAHHDKELEAINFWDALDYIGIDAYFELDAPPNADVDQLLAAWQPHRERLAKLSERAGRPVLFMELGYRPVADVHREPWRYLGGEPSPQASVRAYEAMFRAFAGDRWWRGLYLWKTFTDQSLADERSDGVSFSFRHQPAEETIRRWYSGK